MKDDKNKPVCLPEKNQSSLDIAKACLNIPDGSDYQPLKNGEESEIEKALRNIFRSINKDKQPKLLTEIQLEAGLAGKEEITDQDIQAEIASYRNTVK